MAFNPELISSNLTEVFLNVLAQFTQAEGVKALKESAPVMTAFNNAISNWLNVNKSSFIVQSAPMVVQSGGAARPSRKGRKNGYQMFISMVKDLPQYAEMWKNATENRFKLVGPIWQGLSDEEKAKYKDLAEEHNAKLDAENPGATTAAPARRRRKVNPDAPKRVPNAYILFGRYFAKVLEEKAPADDYALFKQALDEKKQHKNDAKTHVWNTLYPADKKAAFAEEYKRLKAEVAVTAAAPAVTTQAAAAAAAPAVGPAAVPGIQPVPPSAGLPSWAAAGAPATVPAIAPAPAMTAVIAPVQ